MNGIGPNVSLGPNMRLWRQQKGDTFRRDCAFDAGLARGVPSALWRSARWLICALHCCVGKLKYTRWLEAVWEGRWFGIALTGACVVACIYLQWHIQQPGVSVAVMGVAAALMTARTKASGPEKVAWMLIITSLLVSEVLAIREDRRKNDEQVAKLWYEEVAAINTLTGDESFAFLSYVPGQQFLAFPHVGKYPLYGVIARIVDLDKVKTDPHGTTVVVGDMIKGHATTTSIPQNFVLAGDHFNANVFFTGRNGRLGRVLP